jgi:hypothetical protein
MAANIRKIESSDYILDMVDTINDNFESVNDAISDIEEIVNNGDATLNTLNVNANGEITDVSYQGVGKIINNGNIESSAKVKGNTLEVTNSSTFNGAMTANEQATFANDVNFNDNDVNMNSYLNIQKELSIPTRSISSVADTGQVGVVTNNTYNISVEGDFFIQINEAGSDLIQEATYNLTNAKANQVVKIMLNTLASSFILVKLSNSQSLKLQNPKEAVVLVWIQTDATSNTGQWEIMEYSFGFDEATRLI